jgi:hypothetical protein
LMEPSTPFRNFPNGDFGVAGNACRYWPARLPFGSLSNYQCWDNGCDGV